MKIMEVLKIENQEFERNYQDSSPHDVPGSWFKGPF
jgi:hypothetical protein